jgi:hypothetical protein
MLWEKFFLCEPRFQCTPRFPSTTHDLKDSRQVTSVLEKRLGVHLLWRLERVS